MNTTQDTQLPPMSLLSDPPKLKKDSEASDTSHVLQQIMNDFHVNATIAEHVSGPRTMTFYISLGKGVRVQEVMDLKYDFIRALLGYTEHLVFAPVVPGTSFISLTIPRKKASTVYFKQLLESEKMKEQVSKLAIPLGIDERGEQVITSIYEFPHVLISGTVGSGKSTFLNTVICSLLMRTTPEVVRFILMDFKRVEYWGYGGIPHLLTGVIQETDKGLSAFRWAAKEMENRYKQFADTGVRNIEAYNELSGFQALPYIVIVIDEFADLICAAPEETEEIVCRLAQMARATGIHMVIATQRPSEDVLPGLLRANFPTRIAFNTASREDSQTIIDQAGAELLCGEGDMLYVGADQAKPIRIQGARITEKEIENVTSFWKKQIQKNPVPLPEDLLGDAHDK